MLEHHFLEFGIRSCAVIPHGQETDLRPFHQAAMLSEQVAQLYMALRLCKLGDFKGATLRLNFRLKSYVSRNDR